MNSISLERIKTAILQIRNEKVILDYEVARLYGVETKRINEAVGNNKQKFPSGYIIKLSREELNDLRSKISSVELLLKIKEWISRLASTSLGLTR